MTKAHKRTPAYDDQLALGFEPPAPAAAHADLAGLDRVVASAVGHILKGDPRTRFEVAAAVSELLDEDVSKAMLDAYASEARDSHNISGARLLALVAATHRYDVLDRLIRPIGCTLLVGEEVYAAELGHIEAQIAALKERQSTLKRVAQPIVRRKGE